MDRRGAYSKRKRERMCVCVTNVGTMLRRKSKDLILQTNFSNIKSYDYDHEDSNDGDQAVNFDKADDQGIFLPSYLCVVMITNM